MASSLERECRIVAERARSLRIRDFRYEVSGERVTLEGDALTPDGIDSVGKLFATTVAKEVQNRVRHVPPDAERPEALFAPDGYVQIRELGPGAARLAEANAWQVEPNDTLRSIAQTMYGDPEMAIRIVRANRFLRSVDDHLTAGMRLKIPLQ